MTSTGIVRRIDNLGRVVVPKELRRRLRWGEGSPVEVFTGEDGFVCLKKYTSMGEDSCTAQKLADSVAEVTKYTVCVSDMDRMVAVAGNAAAKTKLMEKDISMEVERAISARHPVIAENIPIITALETAHMYSHAAIAPIICEGDAEGAVVIVSKDTEIGEDALMLAKTAALFLADRLAV